MTALRDAFQWPSASHMGAELIAHDEEALSVVMRFTPPVEFASMRGTVQGGLLAGPIDEAFGAAIYLASGGRLQLTLDINMSLLRPVAMKPFVVKARVVKAGRRVAFVEAELFDHQDALCVRASATSMMTDWPDAKES